MTDQAQSNADSRRLQLRARGVVVRGNDIDTDRIIPARFLRCVTFDGLGAHAFEDDRKQAEQAGNPHPFDQERFAGAQALIVNENFGCGSSREHAPQSLIRWGEGIQFIVGQSYAEIFFGNCVSLGVPCVTLGEQEIGQLMDLVEAEPGTEVKLDLEQRKLTAGALNLAVEIADGPRERLTSGRWDSTAELLANVDAVAKTHAALPYTSFANSVVAE